MAVGEFLHNQFLSRVSSATQSMKDEFGVPEEVPATKRQILWSGHIHDYSGYAKANREILFRMANHFRIGFTGSGITKSGLHVDHHTMARLRVHEKTVVSSSAPLLRFYTPVPEVERRYRILFTMMETEDIHPNLAHAINSSYHEVWTPTQWNAKTFRDGGVTLPINVIPLGVDTMTFRPSTAPIQPLPACEVLTGRRKGKMEIPAGKIFMAIFQPTFRKGADVLVRAFEQACAGDKDACLVLGITSHGPQRGIIDRICAAKLKTFKSRIYSMHGNFSDERLAEIYRASTVYVCASRGEGWNLPLLEAAACGVPVIAPMAYSHTDFIEPKMASTFEPDGYAPIHGAGGISVWYDGMKFCHYGKRAISRLSDLIADVIANPKRAKWKADSFLQWIVSSLTWDAAADRASRCLLSHLGE